jgi:hypothetical protein
MHVVLHTIDIGYQEEVSIADRYQKQWYACMHN